MKRSTFILWSSMAVIINAALTSMNFLEWYKIKVLGRTREYPFGTEGPTPYYYKTAELYSTVSLTWGLVFLILSIFSIWAVIKPGRIMIKILSATTMLCLLGLLIQGKIGIS